MNKRSEMMMEYAKWINGGDVRIPDDDEAHSDMARIPLDRGTSLGLRYRPSKDEIKRASGGESTDFVDADGLTFSFPVRSKMAGEAGPNWRKADGGGLTKVGSGLKSLARKRMVRE